MGIPQIAAIMGMCVAGGGYLPVMCDHVLMTDGSGLFLAGPALVQAAIGQKVSAEELGGAAMHSAISGTVDFREPNDQAVHRADSFDRREVGHTAGFLPGTEETSRTDPGRRRDLRDLRSFAGARPTT